jgi:hypothetical protein
MPLERIGLDGNRTSCPLNCVSGNSGTTTSFLDTGLSISFQIRIQKIRLSFCASLTLLPGMSSLNRLLPKSLFAWSKTLFDKSKACSRQCQNSPFGLKQLPLLIFRFAKIYCQKRFNDRSRGFVFGQQPVKRGLVYTNCSAATSVSFLTTSIDTL